MSDTADTSNDAANGDSQGPVGGERLAEARREQQISVLEIAKELHLDEYKVRALERNDFETLGAPVFAKGHLKKYSQLVGVDESDVLADYHQLTRSAVVQPVITTRRRPRREMAPGPWIAVIVLIILVVSAYWWFTTRPLSARTTPEEAPSSQPEAPADPVMEPAADDEAIPATDDDVAADEAVENVAPPAPEPVVDEAELADGEMRLRIVYSGDCWTEITDAGGRRLFFDLGKAGRTVELTGEAPFNVLFGNAEFVDLEVNGADYDLSSAARRGRTARLTIVGN